jgi:capsular exopolysaccharide synthesis family protein
VARGQRTDAQNYRTRPSGGITISVSSPSPGEAALLANQFAEAYVTWTRQKTQKSARTARTFLDKQAEKFRTRVRRAEQKVKAFMQEQEGVGLDQRTSRAVEKVASLQSRQEELRIELDMKKAKLRSQQQELARIRPKLADRLSSDVKSELIRVQEKKADLEAEMKEVRRRNPDLDPEGSRPEAQALARLQERKAWLDRQADSLAESYIDETLAVDGVGSGPGARGTRGGRGVAYVAEKKRRVARLRIEVSGLEAKLRTLEDRISKFESTLDTLPAQQIQLAQLQRDRRAAEDIYGLVREKLQEVRIAEESEVAYAELVEPAGVPLEPVSPNTKLNLVLGLFLGLLSGVGLVFVREAFDTRVRTPEDLKEMGNEVLGVLPSMGPFLEEEFDGADEVEVGEQFLPSTFVMITSPGSMVAEAYRQLHVNLRYARPDASIRSLVVTSPAKGEGKTTTALNLAAAAVRREESVALVDADLRNPKLHTHLGTSAAPGLTEALYEKGGHRTVGINDLVFLPSGETPPSPSRLLGSDRMERLLDVLEEAVSLVVIDTPPVLPFSDVTTLVPHTDGALLVAQAGETDRRAVERASEKLGSVGPEIVGTVLNGFDSRGPSRYREYSYYGYGYHEYGYGAENGSEAEWR